MELSTAFEERVRQMEDACNHRLALLHVSPRSPPHPPPLQNPPNPTSPRRLLPPFALMRRPRRSRPPSPDSSPPSSPPRAASSAAASSLSTTPLTSPPARAASPSPATSVNIQHPNAASNWARSSVKGEIEAERREEDWDRFYEAKRKEMEEFLAVSGRFEAETREEVQRLRDLVSQLKSTLEELQSSEMYSNNVEIAAAEARKSDLTDKKAKLDESLTSARQFRALLQQQLQKAFQSQTWDQKTAQTAV